ncbi:hypothetical protein [Helicobacter sp. T3_23-1056]
MDKHSFLRLYQPRDGYLYNSDSLLLIDFARAFLAPHTLPSTHPLHKKQKSKTINLVDIGAGCGIIGLLCAKHFGVRSHLIEINKYMATLAYINARTNSDCLLENGVYLGQPLAKKPLAQKPLNNLGQDLTQDFAQDFAFDLAQVFAQNLVAKFGNGFAGDFKGDFGSGFEAPFKTDFEASFEKHFKTDFAKSFETYAKSQNPTFCLKNADKPPLARVYHIDFLDFNLPDILTKSLSQSYYQTPQNMQNPQNPQTKTHTKNLSNASSLAKSTKSTNTTNTTNATNSVKNAINSTKSVAKKADFCISNPPFYPDGALRSSNPLLVESRYATSMPLEQWIPQARRILAQRGGLIFCYHPSELSRVFAVLKSSGFTPEVLRLVYPLKEREATLALIFARLDSKAVLKVLPPLFTHISNGTNHARQDNFTPEVANIYATYRTHSIKIHTSDMAWLDL